MENRFIIDWFSFSSKDYTENDIVRLLGLHGCSFQHIKGQHGYKKRLYYESISIHFDGGQDMGVWCELTGKGCRAFESYGTGDFDGLFKMAMDGSIKVTRLDIAYDDFEGIFEMKDICNDVMCDNYISKWKAYQCIFSSGGNSAVLGSRYSDILVRIYDKAAEQKLKEDMHWVRLELQMRDDRAMGFIRAMVIGFFDLGAIFTQVLYNYLRFVVPTNDSNRRRWPNTDYWDAFIEDAGKLSVYEKPGVNYTFDSLYDYVIRQNGGSLRTFIKIGGISYLLKELAENGTKLNPKYEQLLAVHQKEKVEVV